MFLCMQKCFFSKPLTTLIETALLCIKNEIHLALSKGMPTALVLLDLSAAFDTIDHAHSYPVCQLGLALLDRH